MVGAETEALLEEVDRTASTTRFSSRNLLDGSPVIEIATGAGPDDRLTFPNVDARRDALGLSGIDLGADPETSAAAFAQLDQAIDRVAGERARLGRASNVLESRIRQSLTEEENLRAAESRIADADIAQEVTGVATARILEQAAIAVLAQSIEQDKRVLELLEPAT